MKCKICDQTMTMIDEIYGEDVPTKMPAYNLYTCEHCHYEDEGFSDQEFSTYDSIPDPEQLKAEYNEIGFYMDVLPSWESVQRLRRIRHQLVECGFNFEPTPDHWWLIETDEQIKTRIETSDIYCDWVALSILNSDEITQLQQTEMDLLAIELQRRGVFAQVQP